MALAEDSLSVSPQISEVSDWDCPWLADRLYGAKPVTWKGRGDLPQVPWSKPTRGSWLVLDLWSGLGGLCMALLQCGLHFFAIAAEMDAVASELCAVNLLNVIHIPRVESLRAAALQPFLRRRQIRGIIMGSLNLGRQGLGDIRSHQPLVMIQLRDEIQSLPEASGLELVSFLENVGSMPREVESQYSSWMGGQSALMRHFVVGFIEIVSTGLLVRKAPFLRSARPLMTGSGIWIPEFWLYSLLEVSHFLLEFTWTRAINC